MEKISSKDQKNLKMNNETNVCPHCQESQISKNETEESQTKCVKCKKNFIFIKCHHCSRKIFSQLDKYLDSANIKCPYSDCNKNFNRTQCHFCPNKIRFNTYRNESEIITCTSNDCKKKYIKINCPAEKCRTNIIFENGFVKNETLYKEGMVVKCSCDIKFQKINCFNCHRKLVWKNIFPIESQKIRCPYEDCSKECMKMFCPFCDKMLLWEKSIQMGVRAKCSGDKCNKIFRKVVCPHCYNYNNFSDNAGYSEGKPTICKNELCAKSFSLVKCLHCQRPNAWKGDYIIGQNIVCAYQDCPIKTKFAIISCPHCKMTNRFPKGDFSFGKNMQCNWDNCKKYYTVYLCPGCNKNVTSLDKDNKSNLHKITCPNCKVNFLNMKCIHCKQVILDKGAKYFYGEKLKCPYEDEMFTIVPCIKCNKIISFKDDEYKEGMLINCTDENCAGKFSISYCPKCCQNSTFEEAKTGIPIICQNEECKESYKPGPLSNNVYKSAIKCNFKPGIPFSIQHPSKDFQEKTFYESIPMLENLYISKKEEYNEDLEPVVANLRETIDKIKQEQDDNSIYIY